jgi:methyl-accepting chemotaxis protein
MIPFTTTPVAPSVDPDAASQAIKAVERARSQVANWVQEANRVTESEVLSAGNAVQKVAEVSRSQAASLAGLVERLTRGATGDSGVAAAIAKQARTTKTMVEALQINANEQLERSSASKECVELIVQVSSQIERLSRESNMLSLNANIEAVRAGSNGAAFQVVATEMRRLSQQVAQANSRVQDLAERLGALLPTLTACAEKVKTDADNFAQVNREQGAAVDSALSELNSHVGKAITDSESAVAQVINLSQNALSHLQFQDVVSQNLRSIDAVIRNAGVRVFDAFGVPDASATLTPPAYTTLGLSFDGEDEPDVDAGEITFF